MTRNPSWYFPIATLLVVVLGWLVGRQLWSPSSPPSHYWSTVVGVPADSDLSSLLVPLQHPRLLGIRLVHREAPFTASLHLDLPSIIDRLLLAVYSTDPHLNWGRAHLLHQGPLGREQVRLVFPLVETKVTVSEGLEVEETLLLMKPDVEGITQEIIEEKVREVGLRIVDKRRIVRLTEEVAAKLYHEHEGRDFFKELVEYISSGPVTIFILSGEDALRKGRGLVGPTDPLVARQSHPRSLRALYGRDRGRNAFHASDSQQAVAHEIALLCN